MQTRMKCALVVVVAVLATACGDSMSSLNPTAPSALSPATSNVEANAADVEAGSMGTGPRPGNGNGNGNGGNGNGNGNGNQPRPPAPSSSETPGGKVEFEGLIDAVHDDSITVNSQRMVVDGNTVVRHGDQHFRWRELRARDRVHVRANRIPPTAGGLTLQATEIRRQNPGDGVVEPPPPAPMPLVSVSAVDPDASENGSATGMFRLARSGDTSSVLSVSFSLTGSATHGVDYDSPTSVTFPAGHAAVDVTVTPKTDALVEGNELATLTVTAGAGYELGSPVSANVTIADHVVPTGPVVTVVASDGQAHENQDLFDFGVFTLTRTGSTATSLTVTVAFSGNALNGNDYQSLDTTVMFEAGSATADVVVFANPDGDNDPSETVVLTVVSGDGYTPGAPASATVTIQQ